MEWGKGEDQYCSQRQGGESERTRLACLPNDLHVDRVLGPRKLGVG